MKRAILAILATVSGLVFILSFRPASMAAESLTVIVAPDTATDPPLPMKQGPKPGGKVVVDYHLSGHDLNLAGLADGTYVGDAVDIPGGHGLLQVSVTIAGGQMVEVDIAHQPTSTHSAELSGRALPVLREEVLTAQQVPVDAVSGATAVSQAFGQSLLSATGPA